MRTLKPLAIVLLVVTALGSSATDASAYYDATTGRFLSRDPGPGGASRVGTVAPAPSGRVFQRDPAGQYTDGMNLYQYGKGHPTFGTDPTGELVIYAEGAVDKLILRGMGVRKGSDVMKESLKAWAKKRNQEFRRYEHRHKHAWDKLGWFGGGWNDIWLIRKSAKDMLTRIKAACKKGEPIYAYAHSTGSATLFRALKQLSKYNCDASKHNEETNFKPCYLKVVTVYEGTANAWATGLFKTLGDTTDKAMMVAGNRDNIIDLASLGGNADMIPGENLGQYTRRTCRDGPKETSFPGCNGHSTKAQFAVLDQGHIYGVSEEMAEGLMEEWEFVEDK